MDLDRRLPKSSDADYLTKNQRIREILSRRKDEGIPAEKEYARIESDYIKIDAKPLKIDIKAEKPKFRR